MAVTELRSLLPAWQLHLRAARKSKNTILSRATGMRMFLDFCEREKIADPLTKTAVNIFVASILDAGGAAETAVSRQAAVRRFTAWLVDEGEIDEDPLLGLRSPKLDEKITPRLTAEQCDALIAACKPARKDPDFRDLRDHAIVQIMLGAPVRAGEIVGQKLADYGNVLQGRASVFGKGGRERLIPVDDEAAVAVERYLRLGRRGHRLASTPAMWLGARGVGFGYSGLHAALGLRAEIAGIDQFWPHLMRHTAAQKWRSAGGSEEGLMAVGGWSDVGSMRRYTVASKAERALEEARRLDLKGH